MLLFSGIFIIKLETLRDLQQASLYARRLFNGQGKLILPNLSLQDGGMMIKIMRKSIN